MFDLQRLRIVGLEEALRQIPDGVMLVEASSGRILFANRVAQEASERTLGQPVPSDLGELSDLGDRGIEVLHSDGRPYEMEEWPLLRSMRSGEMVKDEDMVHVLADGSSYTLRCSSFPIYDEGRIVAALLLAHDVTEREREEDRLRSSEERFRLLVEVVKDYAIYMLDTEGHVESWNEGARHIKGYSQEEILGQHFSIFYLPEDVERGKPQHGLREAETQEVYEDEGWRVRKDGSRFWASVLITAQKDEAGRLRGFSKVTRDFTERKEAEEALGEAHRQTEIILESITDAFFGLDREWRYTYLNERALIRIQRAKGEELTREELLGKNCWEVFPETVGTTFEQELHRALREQRTVHFEEYSPPIGLWVGVHAYPSEEGLAVYVQDITERKENEEKLAYHAYLLDNIHDAFFGLDREWRFTYINERALRYMRAFKNDSELTREELLGKDVWEVFPEAVSTVFYEKYHEAMREQQVMDLEEYYPPNDVWIEVHVYPYEGGLAFYWRDITERKLAEREIERRAHQQAAVAELGLRALVQEDLQGLMDDAVTLVARILELDHSKVVELLPGGDELLMRAAVGWDEDLIGRATEGAGYDSEAGYTLRSDGPVIAEDLGTERRFRSSDLVLNEGMVSCMNVIIHGAVKPFGVFSAHATVRRSFSEDDVNFLQGAANVLAISIEREKTEERLRDVREAERSRIARDLHDEALQSLSQAMAHAQLARQRPDEVAERLHRLSEELERMERQVRGAIYDLGLGAKQQRPFRGLLEELVELHREMAPDIEIDLRIEDGTFSGSLGKTGRELLRIIGEALTNARRHSGAEHVRVFVAASERGLRAEVEDDGRGFEGTEVAPTEEPSSASYAGREAGGGMGLAGMRERTRLVGGDLRVESAPGQGTKIVFEMALDRG